jgi:hypothetical protein
MGFFSLCGGGSSLEFSVCVDEIEVMERNGMAGMAGG